MNLILHKKQFWVCLIVILASCFLNITALTVILCVCLAFQLLQHKGKLRWNPFPGFGIYLYFFVSGAIIGLFQMVLGNYTFIHVIKDCVYLLLPLLFWLVACNAINEVNENNRKSRKNETYTMLFIIGVIISIYDIIVSLVKLISVGINGYSLYNLRSLIGAGYPIVLLCLFLSIYCPSNISLNKNGKGICSIFLLVSAFIHFSRTSLLALCIFILYSGIIKRPVKLIKYTLVFLVMVGTIYFVLPDMFHNYITKITSSLTEISFTQESWNVFSVTSNWRGYEVYCELNKFQNASVLEKMFGGGLGAQLDLGGFAYLVTNEETIPFLHNGYFTILMIWGIFGIILFLYMIWRLYRNTKIRQKNEQRFCHALIVVIALDTAFINGLFFSTLVSSMMLILGIIYFLNK